MIFNPGSVKPKKVPILNESLPSDATVDVGGSATFEVSIAEDGNPAEYTYQWYVNGSAVSGATSSSYKKSNIAKGIYTVYCEVTNAAGVVKSRTATLTADKYYLFKNGSAALTWGVTTDNDTTASTASSAGSTLTVGTSIYLAGIASESEIDVSDYSKLNVHVSQAGATRAGSWVRFGLASDRSTEQNFKASKSWPTGGEISVGNYLCDISSLTGSYYVKVGSYCCFYDGCPLKIDEVWLS